jgi:hypothetical protein
MLTVYRKLLRLYPASHRQFFGDEMLAVFADLDNERASRDSMARMFSSWREIVGLIGGACAEHVHGVLGPHVEFSFPPRSFAMRNGFRFPKSTVVFMMLILGGVLMAIKKGGDIERSLSQVNPQIAPIQPSHWALVPPVVLLWMFFCALGLLGWVVLFGLRKSGMHRLERMSAGHE